jgi:hypothetical protein
LIRNCVQLVSVVLVFVAFVTPAIATQSRAQRIIRRDQRLRKAEAAASRLVKRFHETLDFNSIFVEQFVTETKLRARALSFGDADVLAGFDSSSKQKAYLAAMTLTHLHAEYLLIQDVNEVPPEVEKLGALQKFFGGSASPKTSAELEHTIAAMEQASNLYRKYFSKEKFQGLIYLDNLRKERDRERTFFHNVPRIEKGNKRFGIPKSVPVYIVRPEVFDYYFVWENGAMRLFYVDILPNFKLF